MTFKNQMLDQEKVKLIDFRIILTIIFIMSTILSIILLYNRKLIILNKEPVFDVSESKTISIINASVILVIILLIQQINLKNKEIYKLEGEDLEPINLDITATYFLIIASIISLYSSYVGPGTRVTPFPLG